MRSGEKKRETACVMLTTAAPHGTGLLAHPAAAGSSSSPTELLQLLPVQAHAVLRWEAPTSPTGRRHH